MSRGITCLTRQPVDESPIVQNKFVDLDRCKHGLEKPKRSKSFYEMRLRFTRSY